MVPRLAASKTDLALRLSARKGSAHIAKELTLKRVGAMALQLTSTKGAPGFPIKWISLASFDFPVPLSPVMMTLKRFFEAL